MGTTIKHIDWFRNQNQAIIHVRHSSWFGLVVKIRTYRALPAYYGNATSFYLIPYDKNETLSKSHSDWIVSKLVEKITNIRNAELQQQIEQNKRHRDAARRGTDVWQGD